MSESTYGGSAYGRHPYGGFSVEGEVELGPQVFAPSTQADMALTATADSPTIAVIAPSTSASMVLTSSATGSRTVSLSAEVDVNWFVSAKLSVPVDFVLPAGVEGHELDQVNITMSEPTITDGRPS